jgi:hypothetical protein
MEDSKTYLPVGRPRYFETGNEPWNFFFPAFQYYYGVSQLNSLGDPQKGYAMLATQKQAWATTALGDEAGSLIRVFNCAAAAPGTAVSVLNYVNDNNFPIDALSCAPYLFSEPADEPGLTAICANLNSSQLVDCLGAFSAFANSTQAIAATYQSLAESQSITSGHHTFWCCYEGGIAGNSMGGSPTIDLRQALSPRYDPQQGQELQGYFSNLQQYGCVDICIYNTDQFPGGDFANAVYGVTVGWFNPPGAGDGSDGKHNNLPDIAGVPPGIPDFLRDVSPMLYAINQWNGEPGPSGSLMVLMFNLRQRMVN